MSKSPLLRVKQLRSCPYISFKYLNFLNLLNHLVLLTVSIVLFLELQTEQPLYTFGYLVTSLVGGSLAAFDFRIAAGLLSMGRTKRKWILKIVYLLQYGVFIAELVISIALWLNFNYLAQQLTQNTFELLKEIDAFKNLAIFLGFSSLLQGLTAYLCVRFRRFLGRQQITVVDNKHRLRELEMYEEAVKQVYQELHQEEVAEKNGKRKL